MNRRKPLEHKEILLPVLPWKMDRAEKEWHREFNKQFCSRDGGSKPSLLHLRLQEAREEFWRSTVLAFEANPGDLYNAWRYLNNHPVFWTFSRPEVHEKHLDHEYGMITESGVEIRVHRIDPQTGDPSDDPALNTKTVFSYELLVTYWPTHKYYGQRLHAWQCDGSSSTYDKAVVKAARHVHELYGNDRRILDAEQSPVSGQCPADGQDSAAPVEILPLKPITINTNKPGKWRFVDTETQQVWRWTDDGFKQVDSETEASWLPDLGTMSTKELFSGHLGGVLADASERLLQAVDRPYASVAGSSGS